MPILDKKFNKIEENNNIIDATKEDNVKCILPSADQTDSFHAENERNVNPEIPKRPVITPRSRDKVNKNLSIDSNSTLPRLVDFVPKSPQKELDASVDTLKRFLDNERYDFEFTEQHNSLDSDIDYNMDAYSSKWILSSHLSTIGEDEEEQSGQECSSNFG